MGLGGWFWNGEREGGFDIHLQTMIFEKPEACSYTTKASCIYKEKVIMNLTLEKVFLLWTLLYIKNLIHSL